MLSLDRSRFDKIKNIVYNSKVSFEEFFSPLHCCRDGFKSLLKGYNINKGEKFVLACIFYSDFKPP